jgi:hypothetical protein
MKNDEVQSPPPPSAPGRAPLRGAHLRTLEALFRHPPAHNLDWRDVLALMERLGVVHRRDSGEFAFDLGAERYVMRQPHAKDLSSSEVVDLRHFLQQAGWSPQGRSFAAATPEATPPTLMAVVDHHGAKIFRINAESGDASTRQITPYDPHQFLHHLTHKDQSREQGQRAPEDPSFYKRIGDALAVGAKIIVIGHGTGKSNAAQHLTEYLRTHDHETYLRIVGEIGVDLSAITTPQLLALAEQTLGRAS